MMKFMFRALVSTPTFCDPWCRTSYMFFLDHEHPERRDWRTTCAWPENFLPLKLWMFFGTSTMRDTSFAAIWSEIASLHDGRRYWFLPHTRMCRGQGLPMRIPFRK